MKMKSPIIITSRLLAGVAIGEGTISIDYDGVSDDGRTIYRYYLDAPEIEYEGNDLRSGAWGGNLQSGLESLLSFMGAASEAWNYGENAENYDLFPHDVMEFCSRNADEISMLAIELEETPNIIEE